MMAMMKEESAQQNKISMNILQSIVTKIEQRKDEVEIDPAHEESQQMLMGEIERLRS